MDPVRVEIQENQNRIAVESNFRDKEQLASIPGSKWDAKERIWKLRLTWPSCVQLRTEFGERLEIGPKLWEWAARRGVIMRRLEEIRDAHDAPEGKLDLPRLSALQRAAVYMMQHGEYVAECDPMGSGKTVMAINTLEQLGDDAYPVLVVSTKIMKDQWAEHFGEWAPDRTVGVLDGNVTKRRKTIESKPDVLIINWALLAKHSRLAPYGAIRLSDEEKEPKELNGYGLRTVIADAAQNAVNPPAKQTRALWAIGHDPSVRYRYPMTGSIGDEAAEDIWSIMHFVAPDEWPTKTKYIDRYCEKGWNFFGGMDIKGFKQERREELDKILLPRLIRRPREIVLPDVPARDEPQIRTVEMTPKQTKAYKQVRDDMMAALDNGILLAENPLLRLVRLLQLASAYGEIDPGTGEFKLSEPSNKIDAMLDVLDEAGNEPVVFFSPSRQLIEIGAERLRSKHKNIPFGMVTGQTNDADDTEAVRRFQAGELRALLVSMGAGGEGLTLTASSICCFLSRPHSRLKNEEAEGRLDRWGQTKPLRVIDLVSSDTLEPEVIQTVLEKEDQFQDLVQDEATLRRWLSR